MSHIPSEFKYIIIPASSAPYEQSHAQVSLEDDGFVRMIKSAFITTEAQVDLPLLKRQIEANAKRTIDESFLQSLTGTSSVDIVSLALPIKKSGFWAVSLYCDDKGISKGLPENIVANELAVRCGLTGQRFLGDVFISRVFDDGENDWFRADFGLEDLKEGAEWLDTARATNAGKKAPASLSSLAQQMTSSQQQQVVLAAENLEVDSRGRKIEFIDNGADVEIGLEAPGATKKDVMVTFKVDAILVKVKHDVALQGTLFGKISPDECSWYLEGERLRITLEKQGGSKWSSLLK